MLGGVVLGGSGSETRGRGFVGVRSMVDGAVKGGGAFFTRLIYTPAARYPWVQPSAPAVTDTRHVDTRTPSAHPGPIRTVSRRRPRERLDWRMPSWPAPSPNTRPSHPRDYSHPIPIPILIPRNYTAKRAAAESGVCESGGVRGNAAGESGTPGSPRPGVASPVGKWICRWRGPGPGRSQQPVDLGALGSLGPTWLAKPPAVPWLRAALLFDSFQNRMDPASIFGGKAKRRAGVCSFSSKCISFLGA
jgi:hypothetical protein